MSNQTQVSEFSECKLNETESYFEAEANGDAVVEFSDSISSESKEYDVPSNDKSRPVNNEDDSAYECKLIVNGKDISEDSAAKMYSDRIELPFVAIMEELGAIFEWESDSVALMYYKVLPPLRLDIEKGKLSYYSDYSINQFTDYSDSPLKYTPLDKEILIDHENLDAFFGENDHVYSVTYFTIDYKDKVVSIGRDQKDYNCTLIVNGKDITEGSRAVLKRDDGIYSLLPFVAIMEELGATFEWESDTVATMYYYGAEEDSFGVTDFYDLEYTLDVSNAGLINKNGESDEFRVAAGNTFRYISLHKELLVDDATLLVFLKSIGAEIHRDYIVGIVTIESTLPPSPIKIIE